MLIHFSIYLSLLKDYNLLSRYNKINIIVLSVEKTIIINMSE